MVVRVKKSYLASGVLSILLICLTLTIFEIVFFFLIAKPEVDIALKDMINSISKELSGKLSITKSRLCTGLNNNAKKTLQENLLKLLYNYELSLKKNNKNVIINIIFIFVLIFFGIIYTLQIIYNKSTIHNTSMYRRIDLSFVPSTFFTILLIIMFQIHFYLNISKHYKFVSFSEIMEVIRDELQQNNTGENANTTQNIVLNTDPNLNIPYDIIEEEDTSNTIDIDNNNILNGNTIGEENKGIGGRASTGNYITPSASLTQLHNIFENQYFL